MTAAYCRWAKLVFLVGLIDCIPSEATKNFQWNLAATLTWDSTLNGRLRIRQHLTAKNRTFSWVLIICFGVPLVAVSSLWCLMSTLQVTCFLQERFSRFKRVVVHLLLFLWMAQWCVGETLEMAETAACATPIGEGATSSINAQCVCTLVFVNPRFLHILSSSPQLYTVVFFSCGVLKSKLEGMILMVGRNFQWPLFKK